MGAEGTVSLIPCDKKCIYQKEGYCSLETPSNLTAKVGEGCAYYMEPPASSLPPLENGKGL